MSAAANPGPFPAAEAQLSPAVAALPKSDILLGYQRKSIMFSTVAPLLVIPKSRRVGLTWGFASEAALAASASRQAGGMDVWYMGYDKEMAREFIDVVAMWARAFGIAARAVEEVVLQDEEGDVGAFRIRFASGFEVVALPSVARALRGKQGLVIIDEAAFHANLAAVLKAAIALLMWGGRVVVISSHNGVDNPFNQLIDEIESGERRGKVFTITFDDAVADGLYDRVALVMRGKGQTPPTKEDWIAEIRETYGESAAEELDCIPATGSGSWINAEDIAGCEHPDAGRSELYQGGLVYLGRDVARRRDIAAIWAFELVGPILWLRERWEKRGATFAEQDAAEDEMYRRYRVAKEKIDQTGMGEKVVEDSQRRHGTTRVDGVLFTGPNRLDLAIGYRDRFEARLIRIAPDPAIRTDHRALKRAGPDGKALIETGDIHADLFWAGALAVSAASLGPVAYAYTAAARVTALDSSGAGESDDDRDLVLTSRGFERRTAPPRDFGRGTW
jgi:phage FluMu gp28-like protein